MNQIWIKTTRGISIYLKRNIHKDKQMLSELYWKMACEELLPIHCFNYLSYYLM